jgi:hypothetical protein
MFRKRFAALAAIVVMLPLLLSPTGARARGFVGNRSFPGTILTDDPFVADEMSVLPFAAGAEGDPPIKGGSR